MTDYSPEPQLFSDELVDLLRRAGSDDPRRLDVDEYFSKDVLREVRWLPRYLYRTGERVWAFEIARDDFLSPDTLDSMQQVRAADEALAVAVLVPEGEPYESVTRECEARQIVVAIATEAGYGFLRFGGPRADTVLPLQPTRIPPALADKMAQLTALRKDFREVLRQFSEAHRWLRSRPRDETDAEEQALLKGTFGQLIAVDPRFVGGHDPLDVLQTVEQWSRDAGITLRDHYYHSYHNFLLGCVVIDTLHSDITCFFAEAFPGSELSIEYIWLLTALYHDVGYLVQRGREVKERLYGVDILADRRGQRREALEDFEAKERNEYWQSPPYRIHRRQLVSLYEHLTQTAVDRDWTAETLVAYEVPAHPLDKALERNFMSVDGHGAASCLRMLFEIEKRLKGSHLPHETNQFLIKHVYVAALSIPFHDGRLREALRHEGVVTLSTRRFPIASLLAFIDSIQDDRRDPSSLAFEDRDTLRDLEVDRGTVKAIVDLTGVSSKLLADKRVEAEGVTAFLTQDGIKFEYPHEFLSQE